jgi:hypothetical protein
VGSKHHTHDTSDLRYLKASSVQSPAGSLTTLELRGPHDARVGHLDGVLIDPARRRVRYFVVERDSWFRHRRYLLPADATAIMDRESCALRVDVDDVTTCEEFEHDSVEHFSDDDVITAMFARS